MNDTAKASTLTAYIAEFVADTRFEDIPEEVLHLGKKSILDALGPALTGAQTEPCAILLDYFAPGAAQGTGGTLIGRPQRVAAPLAALVNGTALHADDYDDTMQAMTGKFQGIHPTAPVFAALLAAAEKSHRSGRDVLTAYHVGVEVACKLFDATAPQHILGGYHSTGTCGALGAAAAIAHLNGQPAERVAVALGIAASQAAGLTENFGTMTKPFHAGRSAQTGLVSADLADRGFTASPIVLEAPRGFFSALGGGWQAEHIEGRIANPWSFVDRGIWLKPWPTGSLSHPGITLMLDLMREHGLGADDIRRIVLKTSENIHRTLLHHRPQTELEAKFSLEFCLACIMVQGRLGLREFTDEFVRRADIQEAIGRVDYRTFSPDEGGAMGATIVTTFIDLELADGRTVSGRLDFGKGSKANPMTDREVEDKLADCAAFCGWPEAKTQRLAELVWSLEAVPEIGAVADCLSGTPGRG